MSVQDVTDPRPVVLPANQPPDRFYAGGGRIATFRGDPPPVGNRPEDWVASVTPLFGAQDLGRTVLPDGRRLADAVAQDPVAWFGDAHVAAFGADASLLVKLLDAGQRLPVHAHPDVPFAARHLGLAHGKTEAWVFLSAARVHLGWRRDVGADELARWVADQDRDAMLGAMHVLEVDAGDAVLVPAGTPHAIGEGAFLVELQEPTDLSILLEWTGFAIDGATDGHLGLGFARALGAVDRRATTSVQVERLRGSRAGTIGPLLPDAAPYFRADRHVGSSALEAGYAVLVVVRGSGELVTDRGDRTPLLAGLTLLVPHAAGPCRLLDHAGASDVLEVLRCRPPAPPGSV